VDLGFKHVCCVGRMSACQVRLLPDSRGYDQFAFTRSAALEPQGGSLEEIDAMRWREYEGHW